MSQCAVLPIGLVGCGQLQHTIVTAGPFAGSHDFAENVFVGNCGIRFSVERAKVWVVHIWIFALSPAWMLHTKGSFQRYRVGLCLVLESIT